MTLWVIAASFLELKKVPDLAAELPMGRRFGGLALHDPRDIALGVRAACRQHQHTEQDEDAAEEHQKGSHHHQEQTGGRSEKLQRQIGEEMLDVYEPARAATERSDCSPAHGISSALSASTRWV